MTRYIMTFHKVLGTENDLVNIIQRLINESGEHQIIDFCSGSGGPMPAVINSINSNGEKDDVRLVLSDLYPQQEAVVKYQKDPNIRYLEIPVDAAKVPEKLNGIRTMVCSFHHMEPKQARAILQDAFNKNNPICIYEISDNSFPKWLWWIAIPFAAITSLFVTPKVRPFTWQQFVFTYIIPIIPLCIAWDGAVSNARTYTLEDMDELLQGLQKQTYRWKKNKLKGKGGNKLYLIGLPNKIET